MTARPHDPISSVAPDRSSPRRASTPLAEPGGGPDRRGEAGQTTAEYALVILGAAAVALLVLAWATQTSGVARLLDAVVDSVISRVT